MSRTAAPRTGEARVVVGRPGDGADTGDEMRSASEWRQVYNNDTNPSFGGGARPPPSAWEKFFFMGGLLFYYTNPSFCEAISTGPAVRSDGIAVDNRSQVSHTVGDEWIAFMAHIITQTPHFVLSEGGFVFVSEPICDVG